MVTLQNGKTRDCTGSLVADKHLAKLYEAMNMAIHLFNAYPLTVRSITRPNTVHAIQVHQKSVY